MIRKLCKRTQTNQQTNEQANMYIPTLSHIVTVARLSACERERLAGNDAVATINMCTLTQSFGDAHSNICLKITDIPFHRTITNE